MVCTKWLNYPSISCYPLWLYIWVLLETSVWPKLSMLYQYFSTVEVRALYLYAYSFWIGRNITEKRNIRQQLGCLSDYKKKTRKNNMDMFQTAPRTSKDLPRKRVLECLKNCKNSIEKIHTYSRPRYTIEYYTSSPGRLLPCSWYSYLN